MAPSRKDYEEKKRKEKLKIKLKKQIASQSFWFEKLSCQADTDEESKKESVFIKNGGKRDMYTHHNLALTYRVYTGGIC